MSDETGAAAQASPRARVRDLRGRMEEMAGADAMSARLGRLEGELVAAEAGPDQAPSWAVCATLSASPTETAAFVHHHLALGADHLFLFFDEPADPAIDAVSELDRVTALRCDDVFWQGSRPDWITARQRHNADLAMSWALARSIDWLVHIDVDEFVHPATDLRGVLAAQSHRDAVTMRALEVVPVLDSADLRGPRVFKQRVPAYRARQFSEIFGPERSAVLAYRGHRQGKSAVKVAAGRYETVGVHWPVGRDGTELDIGVLPASLLHYFVHDLSHWKAKWGRRLASGWPMMEDRAEKMDLARQLFAAGESELQRHFLQHECLTEREVDVALALGLLRRIEMPVLSPADTAGRADRVIAET